MLPSINQIEIDIKIDNTEFYNKSFEKTLINPNSFEKDILSGREFLIKEILVPEVVEETTEETKK